MVQNLDYHLFFKFLEKYGPQGFAGIDPDEALLMTGKATVSDLIYELMQRGVL